MDAGGADLDPFDRAAGQLYLDLLQIRIKTASFDAGDLFTDSALFFGHTAAGNGISDDGSFSAYLTDLHRYVSSLGFLKGSKF